MSAAVVTNQDRRGPLHLKTIDRATGSVTAARPFYPALDGLRAVAFLMVFCNHYLYMPWGWAGVDLFFALSGFLITGILYDSRNEPQRTRNFYIRRTLRIFPLYYGVMLLLLPVTFHSLSRAFLAWPAYVGNFAWFVPRWGMTSVGPFIVNANFNGFTAPLFLGHFWSLCVEQQFYIFWPWVVFWVRDRRKLLMICLLSVPACLGLRILGEHVLPSQQLAHEILYLATPFRIDAILIGGALALLIRGPLPHRVLSISRRLAPAIIAVLCISLAAIPIHRWGGPSPTQSGASHGDWQALIVPRR
jgi:peptidoglycan/LPS O-acetylase OafA/YrhL